MQTKKLILTFYISLSINSYTATSTAYMQYVENYVVGLKSGVKMDMKAMSIFEAAAVNEQVEEMQSLVKYGLKLEQHNFDWVFRCAGFNNKLVSMKWLISQSLFPSQATANITFISAIYDDGSILEWMLSLPLGKGRPDQRAINEAYEKARITERRGSELLLKPYIRIK